MAQFHYLHYPFQYISQAKMKDQTWSFFLGCRLELKKKKQKNTTTTHITKSMFFITIPSHNHLVGNSLQQRPMFTQVSKHEVRVSH